MKVRQIMTEPVLTCRPETWLAEAARIMRTEDCGILPVIDVDGRLLGVLTDRDVCLAIATDNRSPRAIAVHEVMTKTTITARVGDEVYAALAVMKHGRVRRLPVLDSRGQLKGLLSLEDIVIRGLDARAVLPEEIVATLRGLYERRPVPASSGDRRAA